MSAKASTVRDGRKPGWFHIDNDLIDRYGRDAGAIGVAVYCALARFADRDGRAFPSYKRLAESLHIARNTLITALRKLETMELITIAAQTDQAGNPINTNIYTLLTMPQHKGMNASGGGAADERGGASLDPPHAADERGGASLAPRGASAACEEDSSNQHVVVGVGATLAFLKNEGVGAAQEFANLPYESMRLDFQNRIAAGQAITMIVNAWRVKPPTKDYHYERPPRSTNGQRHAERVPLDRSAVPANIKRVSSASWKKPNASD